MTRTPVTSSTIHSVGYDSATKTLEIQFAGKNSVYQYDDVPTHVAENMMQSPSVGQYFAAHIKSASFKYRKIT